MFNLPHFYTLAVTTVANSGPVMNQCVVVAPPQPLWSVSRITDKEQNSCRHLSESRDKQ